MLILAAISVVNLGQWIWTVMPHRHQKFVFKYLQPSAHLIFPLPKPRTEDEEREKEEEEREKAEKEKADNSDNAEQSGDSLSMNQSEQGKR